MSNRKPCYLAGVCLFFYTVILAQPEKPKRQAQSDTTPTFQQPYEELNNEVPPIYYQTRPSALVFIDGDPVITVDEELRMYRILNTPHLIIKNHHDNRFYLYWSKYWYVSDSATYGYGYLKVLPEVIKLIDSLVKQNEKMAGKVKPAARQRPPLVQSPAKVLTRPQIIVTTEPSELIQTKGEPVYKRIDGTALFYAVNTSDDIFMDSTSKEYYITLSGRWYTAAALAGPWAYISADKLPSDFSRIPGTSEKARVMTYVPGTDSARKAIADAKMLQIIKVNRTPVNLNVTYDGGAEFSSVSNTGLFVSENSNIPVVNVKDKYYALQDGIWYVSNEALGSTWEASTERPPDIDKVPPTHRLYNARFVYITDTTAAEVTTGYTGGYLNSFIQNNTIVWGTGWQYKSWCRRSYYQRPGTWGYNMQYSSLKGWARRADTVLYKQRSPAESTAKALQKSRTGMYER